MKRALLATRDESRLQVYRDDLAEAMREDHEALDPPTPPAPIAMVVLAAGAVFAAVLGAWVF